MHAVSGAGAGRRLTGWAWAGRGWWGGGRKCAASAAGHSWSGSDRGAAGPDRASSMMHAAPSTHLQGHHAHGWLPRRAVWIQPNPARGGKHGVSWVLRWNGSRLLPQDAPSCLLLVDRSALLPAWPLMARRASPPPPLPCAPAPRSVWWIVTAATPDALPPPMSFKAELTLPVSR